MKNEKQRHYKMSICNLVARKFHLVIFLPPVVFFVCVLALSFTQQERPPVVSLNYSAGSQFLYTRKRFSRSLRLWHMVVNSHFANRARNRFGEDGPVQPIMFHFNKDEGVVPKKSPFQPLT